MSNATNTERYRQIVEETLGRVRELARVKGAEYAAEGDRLDNFRRNGAANGVSMETCWSVYAGKHWDAIQTFIRDLQMGIERPRSEPMSSRADDLIVYLTLFKLMLEERYGLVSTAAETSDEQYDGEGLTGEARGGVSAYPEADMPCDCDSCTLRRRNEIFGAHRAAIGEIMIRACNAVEDLVGFKVGFEGSFDLAIDLDLE